MYISFRSTPHPVTVTTRIIAFLVGNPYKPSFATVTGWGVDPIYHYIYIPRAQMTSIFEGQPPKTKPFPIKAGVIWVPGMYIYKSLFTYTRCFQVVNSFGPIWVIFSGLKTWPSFGESKGHLEESWYIHLLTSIHIYVIWMCSLKVTTTETSAYRHGWF